MERKADTINVVAHEVAQQRELDRVAHIDLLFGGQMHEDSFSLRFGDRISQESTWSLGLSPWLLHLAP